MPCAIGGWCIDRLGPRVVGLATALTYGAAVFTLGRSTAANDLYTPAFVVVGASGGIFHMVVTLALQRMHPTQLALTTNLLTVMWDLSALVPVLFASQACANLCTESCNNFLGVGFAVCITFMKRLKKF